MPEITTTELLPIRVRAKFFFEGDRKWFLKGVAYGPFRPDSAGDVFGSPDQAARDLAQMREMGINLIRVYHVPPRWLLDLAGRHGIRVLVGIPWAQHVEFLNSRALRTQIVRIVRDAVAANKGHPALFGYLVGSEVPAEIVRWLGVTRVRRFLEALITEAKRIDAGSLYSYSSFPPTEYLMPGNADFQAFNVYLESRGDFDRYHARLQNLADDKPVIFGEFGLDVIRNGEERQAEVLRWHLDAAVRGGAAGTIVFAWTDEWFTGGHDVTDWNFGLVTRDRRPRQACSALGEILRGSCAMSERFRLSRYPRVSVVVCSYNGARTLGDCLRALDALRYPDFEIVLVDDGSTDNTQGVVKRWLAERAERSSPDFVSIVQKNLGLSVARNEGARRSSGEVIAYTDCDCMPDADWLYYLVGTLLSGDFVGVGGANVSPPAVNWVQAAVAASPGGPNHVLLSDVVAEHVPGCNMAFWRSAFERVGGFDAEYRKAGDDVDFCWRLQATGGVVAFSPAAIVWHYRRFTLRAFCSQQAGYGEAEAQLRFKHPSLFGSTGSAKWRGRVYGVRGLTWWFSEPLVYHGAFGQGLFQSIYPPGVSRLATCLSSVEWLALTVFVAILAIPLGWIRVVPALMLLGQISVAWKWTMDSRMEAQFDTVRGRWLVAILAFIQPLVRGGARAFAWLNFKRMPGAVFRASEAGVNHIPLFANVSRLAFWNELGRGREDFISEALKLLQTGRWRYSSDTGWGSWDIMVYGTIWWSVSVTSMTEHHGGPKRLTRLRLQIHVAPITLVTSALALTLLLCQSLFTHDFPVASGVICGLGALWIVLRAFRLKRRVAQLVFLAAERCGLQRIRGSDAHFTPAV